MVITASSGGYGYSDAAAATSNANIQNHHLQGFDNNTEIFNLSTSMEMIEFQNKNLHHHSGYGGPGPSSYHHDYTKTDDAESTPWLVEEDQSLRCVFSCEGNEKTSSQGLSLSLSSSNNPSAIGFQSFELRQQQQQQNDDDDDMRFVASSSRINGFFSKPLNIQNHQQIMQDGLLFLGKAGNNNNIHHYQEQYFLIRNSKYLGAVQELLNEFCDLGTKENDHNLQHHSLKMKLQKTNQWLDLENVVTKKQSLYSLDLLELQKRKTKLIQLLQEVDRRYKHYCDQMKTVTSSFEAIAGNGASKVYSTLASKAMSRHFRCLRDAIVEQIKVIKKSMGEKDDSIAPGTTKGETPRLRVLDQTLRQQRAFQQMGLMETHPWRPQRGLPERSVSVLRAWLFEHFLHPYPSDVDKHILARQTGLSRSQVSNWFINARVRLWKPMVEEMYLEELKEQENAAAATIDDNDDNLQLRNEDEKPTHDQLVRIDSECLSSIVNNQEKIDGKSHVFARAATDSLTGTEMDYFSSYNHNNPGNGVHFHNENPHRGYGGVGGGGGGGSGGGVSLTLGLQQHGGNGVSLAFSSSASQSSLFYQRDHNIEDCQQVEYSLLDNEGQNLPYRNLMGAQLLHDLTR